MEFGKGVSKVPLGNIAKRANYLLYKATLNSEEIILDLIVTNS